MNQRILKKNLIQLVFVVADMFIEMIQVVFWAGTIWGFDHVSVQKMAIAAGRTLWLAGDWHFALLIGVLAFSSFAILAFHALIRMISNFLQPADAIKDMNPPGGAIVKN